MIPLAKLIRVVLAVFLAEPNRPWLRWASRAEPTRRLRRLLVGRALGVRQVSETASVPGNSLHMPAKATASSLRRAREYTCITTAKAGLTARRSKSKVVRTSIAKRKWRSSRIQHKISDPCVSCQWGQLTEYKSVGRQNNNHLSRCMFTMT